MLHLKTFSDSKLSKATTKFQAFSAFLWQTIARSTKCYLKNAIKMGVVVDGRSRLSTEMTPYFGNVIGVSFDKLTAGDLRMMNLSEIVAVVDEIIREGTKKEHFWGLIDMTEEQRPDGTRSRIHCEEEGDGAAFMVSSGSQFPVSEIDFGWGWPKFGSYHFGWGGNVGHIMPMPSASMDGNWVVCVRLMEWQVEALEAEGEGVFRPLTSHHLRLSSDSHEE